MLLGEKKVARRLLISCLHVAITLGYVCCVVSNSVMRRRRFVPAHTLLVDMCYVYIARYMLYALASRTLKSRCMCRQFTVWDMYMCLFDAFPFSDIDLKHGQTVCEFCFCSLNTLHRHDGSAIFRFW